MAMDARSLLGRLEIGNTDFYKNLAFSRVYGDNRFTENLIPVNVVIGEKDFSVFDIGHRNEVSIDNLLSDMVFVPSGIIFEGGTQNRAANYAEILPARTQGIVISVNCAEQMHPIESGKIFTKSGTIMTASARSGVISQDRTWKSVSHASSAFGTHSQTNDYASIVRETDLSDYIRFLAEKGKPESDQIGYIAAVQNGDLFIYSDIFGNGRIFSYISEMLYQSVAAVAKSKFTGDKELKLKEDDLVNFLMSAKQSHLSEVERKNRTGTVYLIGNPIEGSALVYKNMPVQISLRKDVWDGSSMGGGDQMTSVIFRP